MATNPYSEIDQPFSYSVIAPSPAVDPYSTFASVTEAEVAGSSVSALVLLTSQVESLQSSVAAQAGIVDTVIGASGTAPAEDVSAAIDGNNILFGTSNRFVVGSAVVYYNGQRVRNPHEFTEDHSVPSSPKVVMTFTPAVGDSLVVSYTLSS